MSSSSSSKGIGQGKNAGGKDNAYLKDTKYWCEFCKIFIQNNKITRSTHDASPKHQNSLERHLRGVHRSVQENKRAAAFVNKLDNRASSAEASSSAAAASMAAPPPPKTEPRKPSIPTKVDSSLYGYASVAEISSTAAGGLPMIGLGGSGGGHFGIGMPGPPNPYQAYQQYPSALPFSQPTVNETGGHETEFRVTQAFADAHKPVIRESAKIGEWEVEEVPIVMAPTTSLAKSKYEYGQNVVVPSGKGANGLHLDDEEDEHYEELKGTSGAESKKLTTANFEIREKRVSTLDDGDGDGMGGGDDSGEELAFRKKKKGKKPNK